MRDIFDGELNESESLTVEGEIESSPDRQTITFYYFCIMSPDAQEMCEILGIVCVPAWSVYFICAFISLCCQSLWSCLKKKKKKRMCGGAADRSVVADEERGE